HSRAGVGGDPGDLAVEQLALARVQAGSHLDSQCADSFDDRLGAADRPCRPVEAGQEAVAGGVDLAAAEADELAADELVVALEQLAPGAVAERGGWLARAGDGREED